MAEYVNAGAAWKVAEKKTEKHPDFSGTLNVDGVLYFLDVWDKESKAAGRFLSVAIKKKEKQENVQRVEASPVASEDIPV